MADKIYYSWRAIDTEFPHLKGKWLQLKWKMSEADALDWVACVPGRQIEKIAGSGETRSDLYGNGNHASNMQRAGSANSKN